MILALGALVAGVILFYPHLPISRTPTDAEILSLLYGPETEIQKSPDGKTDYIIEQLSEIEKEQFHYASQVNTQIIYKRSGWEHDPHQWIVFTKTGPPDCCDRSFLPVLGSAILTWKDGAWQVVLYQKLITPLYAFDLIPKGEFVEIGLQKSGFRLQDRASQNSGTQTWDLVIAKVDGHLKPVAKIETLANNETQCPPFADKEPCWEYISEYKFVTVDQPGFYEILVTTSGTRLENDTLVSFTETKTYSFDKGEYHLKDN